MMIFGRIADRLHHLKELRRPAKIFRYRRINEYTFKELIDHSLYFAAFPEVNDPLEGTYKYQPVWDDEHARVFVGAMRLRKPLAEALRQKFPQHQIDKLSDDEILKLIRPQIDQSFADSSVLATMSEVLRDLDGKTVGLCCFSELGQSPYMSWFYGDYHKGLCLEYSTSFPPFNQILPVRYASQVPTLVIGKNFVRAKMLTKSPEWKQERESGGSSNIS